MKKVLSLVAIALMAAPVSAMPAIDGTLDGSYGAARAVQTVETGFGDSSGGLSGGGELDAAYAVISGGRLNVLLTGNIEPNFNKVHLFIDSVAGGENVLSATPDYDFGSVSQNMAGLTFDTGFEADYHLYARWGGGAFEVDIVDRAGGGNAAVNGNGDAANSGTGTGIQSGVVNAGDIGLGAAATFLTKPLLFGFDNSNAAGVGGDGSSAADQAAALAVTTGLEISIALADIGNPGVGDMILLHAAYGNGDNNYHSNQILGGLPAPQSNIGGNGTGGFTGNLGGIDFNNYGGNQYFKINIPVPEPTSLALGGLAMIGLLGMRRR